MLCCDVLCCAIVYEGECQMFVNEGEWRGGEQHGAGTFHFACGDGASYYCCSVERHDMTRNEVLSAMMYSLVLVSRAIICLVGYSLHTCSIRRTVDIRYDDRKR